MRQKKDQTKHKKRTYKAYRRTTAIFLLLTVAVLWITADGYLRITAPPLIRDVTVPNFYGVDAEALMAEDWQDIVMEYRYDASLPRGKVISQSPTAGSRRRLSEGERCRITLTVSLGTENILLPNVVGMDVRGATETLRELGFSVTAEVVSDEKNDGRVLSVSPVPGSMLSRGSRVTLTVGRRAPEVTVTVPDVVGLDRSEAVILLSLSGLSVKEIIDEENASAPGGTVTHQSHQGGTVVRMGTRLTLTVAKEE